MGLLLKLGRVEQLERGLVLLFLLLNFVFRVEETAGVDLLG